ncbi:SulP family inorganic anion transporter [Halopseudomonas bauzanensis]|uniref:Sulfate permease, SulP family n=1 Tax=Halopseudomonas bauzanensis TaxID=653930 RepID=A0A1I4LMG4_9GAMM|nr:sulfate permease [Halopseudomonas bauzanensis]SER88804.1 sulfate permease, SulP family [Halopseudomonas bauzanensis]SFL92165.1 sulfate permease, SulP family [Halopseudomonas bauzanensis]
MRDNPRLQPPGGEELLAWLRHYRLPWLSGDLVAGLVTAIMIIPQSMAYAMLAGLPVQIGLYASLLPLLGYALFGTSMSMSVGPVAVTALMTAALLAPLATVGSEQYYQLAIWLALMSGVLLFVLGLLRMGFLANFLSHPVISGFISGASILIVLSQLPHLLGLSEWPSSPAQLLTAWQPVNTLVLTMGLLALAWLLYARSRLAGHLQRLGISAGAARLLARLAPILVVLIGLLVTIAWDLGARGVPVVGSLPAGLPALVWSTPDVVTLQALLLPAALISLVSFVESVSIAQSLARRKRQSINPDRELLALGAANAGSALTGGFAVCGGFSRSGVNVEAGANTPLAGVISAVVIGLILLTIAPLFAWLPLVMLAVVILVAVAPLIDLASLQRAWRYDRREGLTLICTAAGVVLLGIEGGIVLGVGLSVVTQLWRGSRPHVAVVGRVPGTHYFRNTQRHLVETEPQLLAMRIDENIFFANTKAIERAILRALRDYPDTRELLLILSAVNHIDSTGLDMLCELSLGLRERDIQVHLAEVKGPVMDQLEQTDWIQEQVSEIFPSTHIAFNTLSGLKRPTDEAAASAQG